MEACDGLGYIIRAVFYRGDSWRGLAFAEQTNWCSLSIRQTSSMTI